MSCYGVKYQDGEKRIFPIQDEAQYRALRDDPRNVENARLAREGDETAKRHLLQFCYNVVGEDGQLLKETCMMGNTFFYDNDDTENRDAFIQSALDHKEEIGLMAGEQSTHGTHLVLIREKGKTILENQYRVSKILGAEFDNEAKDPQRVVFSGPSSDIFYLDEALFDNTVNEEEAKAEYTALKERERSGQEEVPEWAKKRNKHTSPDTAPSISCPPSGEPSPIAQSRLPKGGVNESEKGEVASTSQDITPAAEGAPLSLGEGRGEVSGEGLDYFRIIPAFFQLENSSYPNIMEGVRNDTLFNVCAKYLRYCCDHNAAKMKELLYPDYSFGLPEKEVDSIIRSALARERGLTPKVVKKVLEMGMQDTTDTSSDQTYKDGVKAIDEMYGMDSSEDEDDNSTWDILSRMYPSVADCIISDTMMPKLPKFLEILLKVCPAGHRFITLGCAIPALMTLLTWVTCKFGTKSVRRLNGWSHLDGPMASGKSVIVEPIELLLTPIKEQDEHNIATINHAIEVRDMKQNQDTLEPIPDLAIRLLPPNTTRNAHIGMMANAKGAHTYTLATELSSLNINAAGYYFRGDFARLLYDNGEVGTVTKMDTQKKIVAKCAWNVTTSSTRDQTMSQWKNATDGSVTRALFLLMPDTTFMQMPDYVQYTEAERAYVIRAARIMTELKGLIQTPRISKALNGWLDDVVVETRREHNTIKAMLRKRSADIAFDFAVVINLCYIVQQIMDEEDDWAARSEALKQEEAEAASDPLKLQEVQDRMIAFQQEYAQWQANRLDLNRFREKKASADMALYVAPYTLETQYSLFARRIKQQLVGSYEGVVEVKKTEDRLAMVPERFKIADVCVLFPSLKSDSVKRMINRWEQAYLIKKLGNEGRYAIYSKVV